jgi:hypothetical protein
MPTTCPAGHDTASTDFCDVCGMRVGGPTPARAPAQAPAPALAPGSPGGQGEYCPRCGADRRGQFCEACGYTLASRPVAPAATAAPGSAPPVPAAAAPGSVSATPGQAVPGSGRVGTAPSYVATVPSQVTRGTGDGAAAEWTAVATADRAYFDSVVAATGPDAGSGSLGPRCASAGAALPAGWSRRST